MQGEATDSLSDIYLLTRATGQMRRVTSRTWDWARRPRLSGDGRFVVFQARLVAESGHFVYRQPVDTAATQPTRVARGFDARSMTMAP